MDRRKSHMTETMERNFSLYIKVLVNQSKCAPLEKRTKAASLWAGEGNMEEVEHPEKSSSCWDIRWERDTSQLEADEGTKMHTGCLAWTYHWSAKQETHSTWGNEEQHLSSHFYSHTCSSLCRSAFPSSDHHALYQLASSTVLLSNLCLWQGRQACLISGYTLEIIQKTPQVFPANHYCFLPKHA